MSNSYIPGWLIGIGEKPEGYSNLSPEEEQEILDSLPLDEGDPDPEEHAMYLGEDPFADTIYEAREP